MAANVETMFYTREAPWHGLGTSVNEAPTSEDALRVAGLDWMVYQERIRTDNGREIPGYLANVRDVDESVLGVVTEKYQVVQNSEAFAFTDSLLGEGVTYETAGGLQNGRKTWILAKMPVQYMILGDELTPYLVFMNSHDGSGAIKVAMTPIRVVCQNTLNLALSTAKRVWSANHTSRIAGKLDDARNTLQLASTYMNQLGKSCEDLRQIKLSDSKVLELINQLVPEEENATDLRKQNVQKVKEDIKVRYFDAPDLRDVGKNGYRFINAISDFSTHSKPLRETTNYKENLFGRVVDGNVLLDRAYQMVKAA